MNNVGVSCEVVLGVSLKHRLHRRIDIVAFHKYAVCEVDEKTSNECRMKLRGSKRDEVVNGRAGVFPVSILNQCENSEKLTGEQKQRGHQNYLFHEQGHHSTLASTCRVWFGCKISIQEETEAA
jgi:hypothetical protein